MHVTNVSIWVARYDCTWNKSKATCMWVNNGPRVKYTNKCPHAYIRTPDVATRTSN